MIHLRSVMSSGLGKRCRQVLNLVDAHPGKWVRIYSQSETRRWRPACEGPHTRSNGVAWSRLRSTTIHAARGWLYAENRRTRCPLTSLASSVRNDSRVCCPSKVSARPSDGKRRLTTRETFLRTSCGNVSLTPDCRLIRLKPRWS